jgi:hypothetical protein
MDELNQDQVDFLKAIESVSPSLVSHLKGQLIAGASFDEVQASLRRAVEVVQSFRIGRGV